MIVLSARPPAETTTLERQHNGEVECFSWASPNVPRLSDYEIAVLDMQIPSVNNFGHEFLGLRREVEILLRSGGVLICLNYFTVPTKTEIRCDHDTEFPAIIRAQSGRTRFEINYDWLPYGLLLSSSNVADPSAKVGAHFFLVSKNKEFADYFKGVTKYHKTIDNVIPKKDNEGNVIGYEFN
jgi:hypothetical protein